MVDSISRKTVELDGVMDIETENWDTFVVGGLWTRQDGFRSFSWERQEEYVDTLLRFEGSIWAHNGGRFDALWFLQHIVSRGLSAKLRCSGQRIITVEVNGLKLRDSAALVPMSLEKASQMGHIQKTRTELPCVCGLDCGGYCSISRGMPAQDYRKLVSYLEQDCLATASFMDYIINFAADHDLDLRSTVGASAYATARRRAGIPDALWNVPGRSTFSVYRQAREGYFGGRTQVFRPEASSGERYDINSAYPAALSSLSLPVGAFNDVIGPSARKAYADAKPGIYRASVRVPECFCPPLPIRGKLRIAYPTGSFTGTWTALELAHAEANGVIIENISDGIAWDSSAMVFVDFCKYIWGLRDNAGPKTACGTWLKWFANSLTGKLAQRPETESVYVNPPIESTFCPADFECRKIHPAPACCEHRCTKACGGWKELSEDIYTKTIYRISECAHVHHAAYLTASTRITLHKQLLDDGRDGFTAVYCDTDSVIATEPRVQNIGNDLGQWKAEGSFRDFVAIAPKTYTYIDERGERTAKSKGIPDALRNWDSLRKGVTINRGVNSFRSAVRSGDGLFHRKKITRAVHSDGSWYGDRILREDGRTWPMDASQLRE